MGTVILPIPSRPRGPAPRVHEIPNSPEHIVLTPKFPGAFDALSFTDSSEHLSFLGVSGVS